MYLDLRTFLCWKTRQKLFMFCSASADGRRLFQRDVLLLITVRLIFRDSDDGSASRRLGSYSPLCIPSDCCHSSHEELSIRRPQRELVCICYHGAQRECSGVTPRWRLLFICQSYVQHEAFCTSHQNHPLLWPAFQVKRSAALREKCHQNGASGAKHGRNSLSGTLMALTSKND